MMMTGRWRAVCAVAAALVMMAGCVQGGVTSCPVGSEDPDNIHCDCIKIDQSLPGYAEPSGLTWENNTLYSVSDEGSVLALNWDGTFFASWELERGDFEGITSGPAGSGSLLYLAIEYPPGIIEFDRSDGSLGRLFSLSDFPGDADHGQEALTFLPDDDNPNGGLFLAGSQLDGNIYMYNLSLSDPTSSVAVLVGNLSLPFDKDLSGLFYDAAEAVLYAVSDTYATVLVLDPWTGEIKTTSDLPGSDQEGVAVVKFMGVQLLFCAHDKGPDASHVWRYKFPFTEECLGDDEDTKPVFDIVIN